MMLDRTDFVRHALAHLEARSLNPIVNCKICEGRSICFDVLDAATSCKTQSESNILSGIPVYYYKCLDCNFIFTDLFDGFSNDQWKSHIYNEEYYIDIDPDYNRKRPHGNMLAVDGLLNGNYNNWRGLDYGGGNGLTADFLRKIGYEYYCFDPFGVKEIKSDHIGSYNFCSVFEVAEHSPDPKQILSEILQLCSPNRLAILVGTHVHDRHVGPQRLTDWWYAAPRNGHISLYSQKSLSILAQKFSLGLFSISENSHLFTRGYTEWEAKRFLISGKLRSRFRRFKAIF